MKGSKEGLDRRHFLVLASLGALGSEGEDPPYEVGKVRSKAVELGNMEEDRIIGFHTTWGFRQLLAGLSRKGFISLVKKKGKHYIYPSSYTFSYPVEEEVITRLVMTPEDRQVLRYERQEAFRLWDYQRKMRKGK